MKTSPAQAGFAEAGEEMVAGLVFLHEILLCECGEQGCRAKGLPCVIATHNDLAKGYLKNRRRFGHARGCAAAGGSWGNGEVV